MQSARDHVARYYAEFFPHETVCELLGRAWRGKDMIQKRELCIETNDNLYLRWKSVSSPKQLKMLFASFATLKFHTGAIYDKEPCHRKKLSAITPELREFVVDIDANDYTNSGVDCDDLSSCDAAWPLVAFGMTVVRCVLTQHFGFKNIMLVYSGRRGAHLNVYDARACALTDETREAIVSFLQPNGHAQSGRPLYGKMLECHFFGELYTDHVLPFWVDHCLKSRDAGGLGILDTRQDKQDFLVLFGNSYALKTLCLNALSGVQAWLTLLEFADRSSYAASTSKALKETVMSYVWPRLDANVSKQRCHLSKAFFSLHPKTGRLCLPIFGDPYKFNVADCPTLEGVVSRDPDHTKRFLRSIGRLSRFVRKLKDSATETWQPPRMDLKFGNYISMVGTKRSRESKEEDELTNKLMFTDRARLCYNITRVFVAVASETEPGRVKIFYYSKPRGDTPDEVVTKVYAGYSPPYPTRAKFPYASFKTAVSRATACPGSEVVCGHVFVCVLLHPRNSDLVAAKMRLQLLEHRLLEGVFLCEINSYWDETAVYSVLNSNEVKETWEIVHIHID
jgi:DNA primase small subunit